MTEQQPTPMPRRRRGIQHVLKVERQERLTPHLARVHLGGPGFDAFLEGALPEKLATTDKYVKMLFPRPGSAFTPPYDLDELRERFPLEALPVQRTYTVRSVDRDARTFAVDFVIHGDEGVAGPWAVQATPGDVIALSGPGGGYIPSDDPTIRRLFIGDDAALPAIAAGLEALPSDASGEAFIEVDGAADEVDLAVPVGVGVHWLHRCTRDAEHSTHGALLAETIGAIAAWTDPTEVFAHGERAAMKQIRRVLVDDWQLPGSAMSLSAYWALGRAEDVFQAEKRTPAGEIFPA